jgi:hypothetical protein
MSRAFASSCGEGAVSPDGQRLAQLVDALLPELSSGVKGWRDCAIFDGRPGIEGEVDRERWPEGPDLLRYFEQDDALVCESVQDSDVKVIVVTADGTIHVSPIYRPAGPVMN